MPGATPQYYRLRITNAALAGGQLTITSIPSGTNPWLANAPTGDGESIDPMTCTSLLGSYSVQIVDGSIGGSPLQRIFTSVLENAHGQQQLGYSPAILDTSSDPTFATNVVTIVSGLLTLIRLVDDITYEATVQDPARAQAVSMLFAPSSTLNMCKASPSDPNEAWFADYPFRGCIVGGPIMATGAGSIGVLKLKDLGGWQCRVQQIGSTDAFFLQPLVVYGPPQWMQRTRTSVSDYVDEINQAASTVQTLGNDNAFDAWTTVGDALTHGYAWNNLVVLIDKWDGNGFQPFKPMPSLSDFGFDGNGNYWQNFVLIGQPFGSYGGYAIRVQGDGTRTLTNGATVRMRVVTVLPTEASPLYIAGHPLDLLAQIHAIAKIPFDTTAATNLKSTVSTLGSDLQMTFRITEAKQFSDMTDSLCALLGIGLRGNDSGQVQVFDARLGSSNSLPSVTITADDVVDDATTLVFELDPAQSAAQITFQQNHYTDQRNVPVTQAMSVVDGVIVTQDEITLVNSDTTALPYGQITLSTDGMLSFLAGLAAGSQPVITWPQYVTGIAQRIFDRFGHGGLALETTLIHGGAGDTLRLGDEALINLPQLPNHNYRLGDNGAIAARRMQVIRRTWTPIGWEVRFVDSGPNAQPLATVPTLSIAASTDLPRTVAVTTVTNAATINAAGYGVRLQWAVVASGGTLSSAQWVDFTTYAPGTVPTTGIRMPPIAAVSNASTVYVRGRCELASALPSNWSSAVSVTLSAINPPTGLAVVSSGSDGSLATLTWTPGSGATAAGDMTDIWLRLSTQTFAQAARIAVLLAGSVQYVIEALTPGTAYIASVQHRDPNTGDVSTAVDVSFTAGATTRTLNAPFNPVGWAGSTDPTTGLPGRNAAYGIAVIAAEYPGYLEVAIATETAVGSGTYGSFVTQVTSPAIASVQGAWTKAMFIAPNDGLRRQLKARHVYDGCTASAYCATVTVLPWTPQALGPMPTTIQCEVTQLTPSPSTDAGVNLRFQIDAVDPFGQVCQVEIVSLQGTGVAVISGFPAVGTLQPNDTIFKVSQPPAGSGPGTAICRGQSSDGRYTNVSITIPEQSSTVAAMPQATCSVTNGSWQAIINFPSTINSFKYLTSTSGLPSVASVLSSGTLVTSAVSPVTLASPGAGSALSFGQTIYGTIVPFTGTSGGGTQLTPINFVGAFITYGSSKTAYYAASQFTPKVSGTGYTLYQSDASLRLTSNLLSGHSVDFVMFPVVPNNVTLTQVNGECYWSSSVPEGTLSLAFGRITGSTGVTSIGSGSASSNIGWQVVPMALSPTENTSGNSYVVDCSFAGAATPSELGQAGIWISYTPADPSTTL